MTPSLKELITGERVEIQTVKQINQHNAALFGCGTLEHCIPSLKLSFLTNQMGLIISYLLFHLPQLPTFYGSLPVSEIHQMLKLPSLCLTIPAALSVWGAPFRYMSHKYQLNPSTYHSRRWIHICSVSKSLKIKFLSLSLSPSPTPLLSFLFPSPTTLLPLP